MKKKDPNAVALGKKSASKLTAKQLSERGRKAGLASAKAKKQMKEHMKKMITTRWEKYRKNQSKSC